jgi:hypothetical protein
MHALRVAPLLPLRITSTAGLPQRFSAAAQASFSARNVAFELEGVRLGDLWKGTPILAAAVLLVFGANVLHIPNFSPVQQVRGCRTV